MGKFETKNRAGFKKNSFGDQYLYYINGDRFNNIAYSTLFKQKMLAKFSDRFTFYIITGMDSGLLVQQLESIRRDSSNVYLIIEDNSVLEVLDKKFHQSQYDNILISNFENWQKAAQSVNFIKYLKINRVRLISSFAIENSLFHPYETQIQKLQEEIEYLKWLNPDKFQKKIYIQRQLENCRYNINPAISLKNKFKGQQALILAGGPSLDHYIDWIEHYQEKYIIIAASRIANRLLSTTIIPDFFITADPYKSAYDTSKEVLAFSEKSVLVSQNYAHPKIISQWQGKHYYLGDLLSWADSYNPDNIDGIGPTVANCAIHFGLHMGINDQILIGVDLCYTSQGQSHANGSIESTKGKKLGFTGIQVTTNNNKQTETTYEMSQAAQTISLLAELATTKNGGIITFNPDAVKIEGVNYQEKNSIQPPQKQKITYKELIDKGNIYERSNETLHESKIIEEFNNIIIQSNYIVTQTNKILSLYLTIYPALFDPYVIPKEHLNSFSPKDVEQLEKYENNLIPYKKAINIIENFGTNDILNYFNPEPNRKRSVRLIERDAASYYKALYIASNNFINHINNTISNINKPILTKETTDSNTSNKDKKNSSETASQNAIILDNTENKLYNFFKKKDSKKLNQLVFILEQYDSAETKALVHLAKGYIHELNDDMELAIDQYLHADSEKTLESALKRLVSMALKTSNFQDAVIGYQTLATISDNYLIPLAQLFQTAKQYKDALDTYSQYIDSHPKDILILIEMAQLYLSLDIIDGAKFILNHILEISPNDQTASILLREIETSEK